MPKNDELPLKGPGVERLEIKEIDRAIAKYQRKKEERCNASPGEIAAKQELQSLLHQHRDELPRNDQGIPFYRADDRDYLLEEKLKIQKVAEDGATEED